MDNAGGVLFGRNAEPERRLAANLARTFHAREGGAPACCRFTASEWPKPATCRRSGLSAFCAGHELSGVGGRGCLLHGEQRRYQAVNGMLLSLDGWLQAQDRQCFGSLGTDGGGLELGELPQ